MIEKQSITWKAVETFIQEEKKSAVESLIGDDHSEQQRGAIAVLDRLAKLAEEKEPPLAPLNY